MGDKLLLEYKILFFSIILWKQEKRNDQGSKKKGIAVSRSLSRATSFAAARQSDAPKLLIVGLTHSYREQSSEPTNRAVGSLISPSIQLVVLTIGELLEKNYFMVNVSAVMSRFKNSLLALKNRRLSKHRFICTSHMQCST